MSKVAAPYLEGDGWSIVEKGFHAGRSCVSESIFALANEVMGARGYLEEGYQGETLVGTYFNGVFEEKVSPRSWMKGVISRTHFMVNALDWFYTRIQVDGEILDLSKSKIQDFERRLDLKQGTLTRTLVWTTARHKKLRLTFTRFLSMVEPSLAAQEIEFEALNFSGIAQVKWGLDFSPLYESHGSSYWQVKKMGASAGQASILAQTPNTRHKIFSSFRLESGLPLKTRPFKEEKLIGLQCWLALKQGQSRSIRKMVVNLAEKDPAVPVQAHWKRGLDLVKKLSSVRYDQALKAHQEYWKGVWRTVDVTVEGDAANQQGIRFCIFQLYQTYHGVDPSNNVGAKGLTGELYNGLTFWDTETYCLPFYLFNNPKAARNLLAYRYQTLPQALQRARELDCEGARYPMTTIDGTEACEAWAHGDLEIHVSSAVSYAIWHYANVTGDRDFLYKEGIEMLLQVSRFYASRGAWSPKTGEFGFWGVMGPDEFMMMAHNNAYTNVLAKKTFEWTLETLERMRREAPAKYARVCRKVGLKKDEPTRWKHMAARMRVNQDKRTGLFEQHDGYFDMPHIDVKAIPPAQFPLYKHWAYVRIFPNDMTKQPDALLLHFFFSHEHSLKSKKVNYEYYEPRCVHESSLSPSVFSILAAELGKFKEAYDFYGHAARLDLDDYNRNTREGLHTTSMAAAWMNIVYGFGGMRSDGPVLSFNPSIPKKWKSFSFRIVVRGSVLNVKVGRQDAEFKVAEGAPVPLEVFGRPCQAGREGISIKMPASRVA